MTYIYSSSKEIADSSRVIKASGELWRSFLTSEEDIALFNLLYILLVQHTHFNAYFYFGLEAFLPCPASDFFYYFFFAVSSASSLSDARDGADWEAFEHITGWTQMRFFFLYCLVASSCDEHKEFSFDWHDILLKQKWSISIQAPTACFFSFMTENSCVAVVLRQWRLNCSFSLNPLMGEVARGESKLGHFRSLLTSQARGSSQFLLLWLFCVQPELPLVDQRSHSSTEYLYRWHNLIIFNFSRFKMSFYS